METINSMEDMNELPILGDEMDMICGKTINEYTKQELWDMLVDEYKVVVKTDKEQKAEILRQNKALFNIINPKNLSKIVLVD